MAGRSILNFTALGLALCATAASAFAAPRPDVSRMSCAQAQALIQQSGARVVTTGRHTYSRYVTDGRYCDAGDRFLHPAYTPTTDQRACFIGYTCESWSLYFPDD
jgi:hypothetical protein